MIKRARGICRICGKNRLFFDDDRKLCTECAKKFHAGEYTEADIQKRVQGRQPKMQQAKQAEEDPKDNTVSYKNATWQKKSSSSSGSSSGSVYRCEHCNSIVKYGSQKCSKCGEWISWLRTKAEADPDLIICPECGTALGTSKQHENSCPKCGYGAGSSW